MAGGASGQPRRHPARRAASRRSPATGRAHHAALASRPAGSPAMAGMAPMNAQQADAQMKMARTEMRGITEMYQR